MNLYAVIETDSNDVLNKHISHWYFKNINDAIKMAEKMNSPANLKDGYLFTVITLIVGYLPKD